MNATNLVQIAREKKRNRVLGFLEQAFNDFSYPVYLFSSYATGEYHGHSDVDIVIIAPDALAKKVYSQACNQMAELGMNYDILIAPSINRLNSSMVNSLQALSVTAPCVALERCSRCDSTSPIHGVVPPASMQSHVSVRPHPNSAPPSRHQRGLTLVELMIAMLLGLFLIGGVLLIFVNSYQTNKMQEGLSRLQENGRFAMDFITRDIRMAGFLGCAEAVIEDAPTPKVVPDAIVPVIPEPQNITIITGKDAITINWIPAPAPAPVACSSKCIAGTDAISMRHADSCGGTLLTTMASASSDISIVNTNTCGISAQVALIIADCNKADIFRADKNSTQTVIKHKALSASFSKTNAELFMYRDHSYFIRTSAGGRPALWMLDNTQPVITSINPVELVEGIEDMQILYGVDTEMDYTKQPPCVECAPNYYVKANSVAAADWAKVVSVRISLLVSTLEDTASKPLPYIWKDPTGKVVTITPKDRRLRRVFNSTIAVRNRLP